MGWTDHFLYEFIWINVACDYDVVTTLWLNVYNETPFWKEKPVFSVLAVS